MSGGNKMATYTWFIYVTFLLSPDIEVLTLTLTLQCCGATNNQYTNFSKSPVM